MSIRTSTAPNMIGKPNTQLFDLNSFEALIWNKGSDIILEQAIACPCRGKSGSAKVTCQSCLGLGWVFVDPVQTKAIVSSINAKSKFTPWSPEFTGIINITVRDSERFSYMDKVTFKDKSTVLSEVRPIIETTGQKFVFCSYPVKSINSVHLFVSDAVRLIKLSADKYTIKQTNNLVVELNNVSYPTGFNGVVSIDYNHEVSYQIIDVPHDIRSTYVMNERGQNVEVNLPVQGVAQRSHIVFGKATNYAGNNILDNT
jgi:hypothetical protein